MKREHLVVTFRNVIDVSLKPLQFVQHSKTNKTHLHLFRRPSVKSELL